jgi:hypothetical protein
VVDGRTRTNFLHCLKPSEYLLLNTLHFQSKSIISVFLLQPLSVGYVYSAQAGDLWDCPPGTSDSFQIFTNLKPEGLEYFNARRYYKYGVLHAKCHVTVFY